MIDKKILNKLICLENIDFTKEKKIEFIEKLYKLANISFTEYIKNGQTNSNK